VVASGWDDPQETRRTEVRRGAAKLRMGSPKVAVPRCGVERLGLA
jgi:hypothetical protein